MYQCPYVHVEMFPDQDQWAISLLMPNFFAITYVVCLYVGMQNDLMVFCFYEEFPIEAWFSTIEVK